MLTFQNINLNIETKSLIKNASGEILPSDNIVLTGNSGSGKSLLLKILASIMAYNSGAMTWQNQSVTELSPAAWRHHIGYIHQMPALIEGNVLQNLQLPFTLKFYQNSGLSFDVEWHIERLTAMGKTADFLQQPSSTLSGGERQLINLLRCLQLSPSVLLLDEPTAALDATTSQHVEQLVINWQKAAENRACVWVTHDTSQHKRLLRLNAVKNWQMNRGTLSC